ncbi:alcohol dehydrogenase catalytic domain-containing protein [Brevibacillus agri]|uniref:zinc-dependent alcohol dehydrogenase n=1 Tax=Brevibacillus TaxID=55080 RepID=UPI00027176DF|nr:MULTISPECIES: alcohol dehydrogenase catalytic domain-containing protein [Brevibacillus]EJL40469.1 theronine dehydrogenase-like Zn-dependent dehydrogenase [Brevibacillus sp. CF112]MBY0052159.1 alcohol dehydrogenase catalytic domain-containing protein [Brevibacillus agri]MDN4093953.1 alcohol dehydrogenase catalytic domain-containing protein [Brevibacillus agri]MDR9507114.1 alcohol dehydrogenase catalytic domain-containing protein [Brevibacillus agri]MED1645412.1 alcohol dehydrogenase catalyti
MLAGVFEQAGKFSLQERPVPVIQKADEVRIKVEAASICGTDVHILANPPGHPATAGVIQGHEYVGKVVEAGADVTNVKVGDRVVVDPTLTCGYCDYCQMGYVNMCEHMSTMGIFVDGGWTSYSVVPARNVHKIADSVPPEIAVFAEPLSCVINGMDKIKVQPGESAVVLGAGPMGQMFIQMLKAAGAGTIVAVDFSDYRLEYARISGANVTVNPKTSDVAKSVQDATKIGADVVIDCVGSLFDQSLTLVRRGGQILLVGMNQHALPPIKQNDITRYEVTVKGTYISNHTFPKVVKVMEAGLLNLERLITHRVPLERITEGIDVMKKGEAIKVIVQPA